jgi:hypothetical protein
MRPRPGVWPVSQERRPERTAWIERYEQLATGFAACTFLASIGSGAIHEEVEPVLRLHDELTKAASGLPMA